MKVRVLGASGSEIMGQYLTGFLIDGSLLLDPGSVTSILSMKEQSEVRDILLSHAHLDHIRDIPFLADNILTMESGNSITLWGTDHTLELLEKHIFNDQIWPDFSRIPSEEHPVLLYQKLNTGTEQTIGTHTVLTIPVNHSIPSAGFIISGSDGESIGYSGDTGQTDAFWHEVKQRQVRDVIVEVSFPNRLQDVARQSGHYAPEILLSDLEQYGLIHNITLHITHIKPQFREEIMRELRESLEVQFLKSGDVIVV